MQIVSMQAIDATWQRWEDAKCSCRDVIQFCYGDDWAYIGRGYGFYPNSFARSSLANPFYRNGGKRGCTLERYRCWLWEKIKAQDEAVMAELRSFSAETTLICHCPQPGPCHGHIVKAAWQWLQTES